jgi:hypothetical protein
LKVPEKSGHKFHISTQINNVGRADQFCRVTKFSLHHDHIVDPILFAHLFLSDAIKIIVKGLVVSAGCSAPQIATFLKEEHEIILSTIQVAIYWPWR